MIRPCPSNVPGSGFIQEVLASSGLFLSLNATHQRCRAFPLHLSNRLTISRHQHLLSTPLLCLLDHLLYTRLPSAISLLAVNNQSQIHLEQQPSSLFTTKSSPTWSGLTTFAFSATVKPPRAPTALKPAASLTLRSPATLNPRLRPALRRR